MSKRTDAQDGINAQIALEGAPDSISPTSQANTTLQPILTGALMRDEEAAQVTSTVIIGDNYKLGEDSPNNQQALTRTTLGVEEFVGELGGGYTDQFVFTKLAGGLRFKVEDSFEFFAIRRESTGDTLGAVFGNFDTTAGNFFATSESGGLTVCQKTTTAIQQQIGNPASVSFIEDTLFSFQITSDQVIPFGSLVLNFVGETDVDFVDVPFDVRILDAGGTVLFSDIQNLAIWEIDPDAAHTPTFKLSSVAGVVTMLNSQPFPMNANDTYTVEYRFATPIRLKGDGAIPALVVNGTQLEYYPINYTGETFEPTSDFIANSGGHYKVDTSGGTVTATVHPTVKSVVVGDWDLTWSNANQLILATSAGNIVFGTPEKGQQFEVIKDGAGYRVYNADGSLHATIP